VPLTDPVYLLAILLATIFIAPAIANKLHIPALVVLIILGTILGSNVLNIISRDPQLILLEKAGLLSIMFLAGLQMDLSNLKRLGKRTLLFGLLTFFLPLIIGIVNRLDFRNYLLSSYVNCLSHYYQFKDRATRSS
jgi:Kef-type K+ transport system membrane component KefB